ncbi:MAG: 50S ribosomal protein L23 [Candidatus Roizmanbacteria bacterium]|nr:MAG: 50S ribosomal protein L23 [Candidatus Roizmanbacteria bacterium]
MKVNNILIKPVLTEKVSQAVKDNTYAFEVNPKASKTQIANFLEKLYKVKVKEVRILNRVGKLKKVGRKMQEKKSANRKIAYVQLISGSFDFFPKS